jgi:ABC-type transport system substrate-binding protein
VPKIVTQKIENNKYLRYAITAAFDYEKYVKSFYAGGENAQWLIPPSIWKGTSFFTNKYKSILTEEHRKKEVKKYIKLAGYDPENNKPIPTIILDTTEVNQYRANHFKNDLVQYGINIKINLLPKFEKLRSHILSGNSQMFMMSCTLELPLPDEILTFLYSKEVENYSDYRDEEYDQLYEQYVHNKGDRDELISKMRSKAVDSAVYIPLVHSVSNIFVHTHVENIVFNPLLPHRFKYMKVNANRKARLIERLEAKDNLSWYKACWFNMRDGWSNFILWLKSTKNKIAKIL